MASKFAIIVTIKCKPGKEPHYLKFRDAGADLIADRHIEMTTVHI